MEGSDRGDEDDEDRECFIATLEEVATLLIWASDHFPQLRPRAREELARSRRGGTCGTLYCSSVRLKSWLLGNCFWREGLEGVFGPERMGAKGGCLATGVTVGSLDLLWVLITRNSVVSGYFLRRNNARFG